MDHLTDKELLGRICDADDDREAAAAIALRKEREYRALIDEGLRRGLSRRPPNDAPATTS